MNNRNLAVNSEGGICTIIMKRPEVRNAYDFETLKEMRRAVDAVATDDSVKVLVFTGAGDEAFTAGTDVRWLQQMEMLEMLDAFLQRFVQRVEDLWKPSIAAINGFALGGGCELALACDIRIASERAQFGLPEVRLGMLPGAGGTQRLPQAVGLAKAKELIFTGEIIGSAEAERIGLVNRVVPHEQLMPTVRELATKIIRRGPMAVRLAKVAINAGVQYGPGAGHLCERLGQTVLFGTKDRIEGTTAFLEKRHAEFRGS